MLAVSFLTLVAVVWYACITNKQWRTMNATYREIKTQTGSADTSAKAAKSAAETASSALISVQRAFVIFGKNMQDNAVFGPNNTITSWEFRPRVENSGTTPTRRAIHRANFFPTANLPLNFRFPDFGDIETTPFSLGSKETATGALLTVPFDAVNAVRPQTGLHMFFWGWARYRDVFPETPEHISLFCIELTEVRGELRVGTNYNMVWQLCLHHNCADDECDGEPYGNGQVWHAVKK